jgi:hypothetical protein
MTNSIHFTIILKSSVLMLVISDVLFINITGVCFSVATFLYVFRRKLYLLQFQRLNLLTTKLYSFVFIKASKDR